jgi:hypothetical protein
VKAAYFYLFNCDDWRDPDGLDAYFWLSKQEIIEAEWRRVRRRASLFVAFSVPALVGLLVVSFQLVTRTKLTGWTSVMTVAAVGGLLGGVLWCVARMATLAATSRHPSLREVWPSPNRIVLAGLSKGLIGGLWGGGILLGLLRRDSYRAQTVYLIGVAVAVAAAQWTILSTGSTIETRAE